MNAQPDVSLHPCFNEEAKGVCGRVHLPVAPRCNIKCNYCDRRYDCVNESRPGVTSAVLSPGQALLYLKGVVALEPSITVVGIAGPGDPLANPEETFGAMEAIRAEFPRMLFCLSTNGLALPAHLDEIARLGVTHVTVTVNTVDPAVGESIYGWARDGKVIYRGRQAAELLLERQLEGIRGLKERGIITKVNTILVPGVNEPHIQAVATRMASLGVDIMNVMAMAPNPGTPFGHLTEPDRKTMEAARDAASAHLPQMRHCQRCRADAVGLLGCDRSREFAQLLSECSNTVTLQIEGKPYVAVASREGLLVNLHLGEADSFQVWGEKEGGYGLIEERRAPAKGGGVDRWRELAAILGDCRAVLASSYGEAPAAILAEEGVAPLEVSGLIDNALRAIYGGEGLNALRSRKSAGCRKNAGCGGDGGGCG